MMIIPSITIQKGPAKATISKSNLHGGRPHVKLMFQGKRKPVVSRLWKGNYLYAFLGGFLHLSPQEERDLALILLYLSPQGTDGPTCPRCGKPRAPSGVAGGGIWCIAPKG
jgi:hypothetical protein